MKYLISALSFILIFSITEEINGQAQSTVEMDSDSNNPHISIMETESGDFARMWFQHSLQPANKWALNARTQNGTFTNDGLLAQPFVFAFNGSQKLAISSDGKLRINNQYTIPNLDGTSDQILTTDGEGTLAWVDQMESLWATNSDGIEHDGLVTVNPISNIETEPAFTVQVNRMNLEPIVSIRNTNGGGDAAIFMNAEAKYWAYGIDSDINTFKINHLGNGINTTLNDGNQRFSIRGDNGYIGFGTDDPAADLDLANNGADIRFSDSNSSAIQWYESGTEVAFLGHNNNNVVLKNSDTTGDIIVDAKDDLLFRVDGINQMLISDNGEVSIEDVLRLKPRATAPTCANGRLYYDSTDNKVYACSGGTWKALQFE